MGLGILKGTKAVATGGWRALGGLGSHSKGALLGTGLAYGGWKYMTTGHVPGEQLLNTGAEVVEKAGSAVSKGLDAANKGLDYVNEGLDNAPELIHDTKEALTGGVSAVTGGTFNGGTGSMLGLVAGAFLLFGGFGWMGKIAGALLAALSLGLFSGNNQQQQVQQVPVRQESREDVIYPNMDLDGQIDGNHTIHRLR